MEPIAVIGMACRVPGAADLDRFWHNITTGVQARTELSRDRLLAAGATAADVDDPDYVPAAYLLEEMESFDAGLFGMTPREAALTDPQHRLFLELCHAALENAGWDPAGYPGDIAVYGGRGMETYRWQHLYRNREVMALFDHTTLGIGTHADTFTTLVSHKLDLRGPSVGVYTACSTSLVAIHLAAEALRAGECDMALAGGTNVELPAERGYRHREGGSASADGYSRPFDAKATGTVWGSGGGAVLLKRLDDALADADHVYAVIRGNAVNNDGAAKAGFAAPSVRGQAAVIAAALAAAEVTPRQVSYVEAFGLGSPITDQIEVEALRTVFGHGNADRQWCALGSVKSNIGHLSQGAGVVSFIKTVLALKHRLIPPTAGFSAAHPDFGFETSPFYVNASLSAWEGDGAARLAGVSAFGVGGTNAHVLLEEFVPEPRTAQPGEAQLLQISARTPKALTASVQRLASYLDANSDLDLAAVAHTLRVGRAPHAHRVAVVASDVAQAIAALRRKVQASVAAPSRVLALLPEQTPFDEAVEAWQTWGVRPDAVLGVGAGELAAATLAGVFGRPTGAALAELRQRLLAEAPAVGLVAVNADPGGFELPEGAFVAAVNTSGTCVVGGDEDALAKLAAQGVATRPMPGSHRLVPAELAQRFAQAVLQAAPAAPAREYLSPTTGQMVTAQQVTDPRFWAGNLTATVQFGQCLALALREPAIVVECGDGQLARFAQRHLPKGQRPIVTGQAWSGSSASTAAAGTRGLLAAAGQLWALGVAVTVTGDAPRVALPGYPYERIRHWIEPDAVPAAVPAAVPDAGAEVAAAPVERGRPQDPSAEVAAIWGQLLGVDGIGERDDFFELGGTSLLAVQLIARLREVFGVRLPMRSVFDTPTVQEMAAKVAELQAAAK